MWEFLNNTLLKFKDCFTREKSFKWFATIIIGLIMRTDHLGITSILRILGIDGHFYESMLHFFRASSWDLSEIRDTWIDIVKDSGEVYLYEENPVILGDGVKAPKEAERMPAVMKLHQESENSSKPEYIYGHMFGGLGIVLGNETKKFCAPISMRIHDGNETIGEWQNDELTQISHVVRMIREAHQVANRLESSAFLTLDRYFLTVPALIAHNQAQAEDNSKPITIVAKGKSNIIVYTKPEAQTGRGRPRKKGEAIKLKTLFTAKADNFVKDTCTMYGEKVDVEYLCENYLWGQKLYQELRFVLVKYKGVESILVSTDLNLKPTSIIELYSIRFKTECSFREQKQVFAGFGYHFWSKAMPKLDRYKKNSVMQETLQEITDPKMQEQIISAYKAIEGFTMFSSIAMGLTQLV